jgi:uncharacterized protein (DUF1786 family)
MPDSNFRSREDLLNRITGIFGHMTREMSTGLFECWIQRFESVRKHKGI